MFLKWTQDQPNKPNPIKKVFKKMVIQTFGPNLEPNYPSICQSKIGGMLYVGAEKGIFILGVGDQELKTKLSY